MPQLLTLSRAARLAGIARSSLQKKIRNGELPTFEGMISVTELLRAYPETQIEDNTMLERVEAIKAHATPSATREKLALPTPEVLINRINALSHELVTTKIELNRYTKIFENLQQKLEEIAYSDDTQFQLQQLISWLATEVENHPPTSDRKSKLLAKDTFLRIMAAHIKVVPSGHDFFVEGTDSLLEGALKAGLTAHYGCSSGQCGACKARVLSGTVWKIRDHDYVLSQAEKDLGYILMCSNTAITDLEIEAGEAKRVEDIPLQTIPTQIRKLEYLTEEVLALHLQTPRMQTLRFLAGQYATLSIGPATAVDCFIASCPCDGRSLEFHLHKKTYASFIEIAFEGLKTVQPLTLEGPKGHFILQSDAASPALFLVDDEGFAPIKGLIEHAISIDKVEAFHLYWVTDQPTGHYLSNLCRSWQNALDNFHYTELTATELERQVFVEILDNHPHVSDFEVYIAGQEAFVQLAAQTLQQYQIPENQIHVGYFPPRA